MLRNFSLSTYEKFILYEERWIVGCGRCHDWFERGDAACTLRVHWCQLHRD